MQQAGKDDNQVKYLEAADLFREVVSKEPEYAEALFYLGFLFESGFGVEQDMRTAFRYYE
jgi:TPR repeat protein